MKHLFFISLELLTLVETNINLYVCLNLFLNLCINFITCSRHRKKWRTSPDLNPFNVLPHSLAAVHSFPGSGGIPIEVNERLSHPRGVFGIVPRHQSILSRRLLSLKYVRRGWKRADDIHTRCQRDGGCEAKWRFPKSSTAMG